MDSHLVVWITLHKSMRDTTKVMAAMVTTDPRPLGSFQGLWAAWNETSDVMLEKDIFRLRRALELQVDELEAHLYAGQTHAAAAKALDSIAEILNFLRRMGYTPEEIAATALDR
jgi:hypothetical protein